MPWPALPCSLFQSGSSTVHPVQAQIDKFLTLLATERRYFSGFPWHEAKHKRSDISTHLGTYYLWRLTTGRFGRLYEHSKPNCQWSCDSSEPLWSFWALPFSGVAAGIFVFRPDWKGVDDSWDGGSRYVVGLILFNDPRIDSVFTKQGVVWLHTVLRTRFPMMSDDGNGLNMLDAARYSLDPCIHFITHLPLSSEVCFGLSQMRYSTPLFFFIFFFTCKLTRSPYFLPATHPTSPLSHLPSPISLKSSLLYIYIYFKPRIPLPPSSSHPPQKKRFFSPVSASHVT